MVVTTVSTPFIGRLTHSISHSLRSLKLNCRNDNRHNTHNHADCGSVAVAVLGKALVKHGTAQYRWWKFPARRRCYLYQRVLL